MEILLFIFGKGRSACTSLCKKFSMYLSFNCSLICIPVCVQNVFLTVTHGYIYVFASMRAKEAIGLVREQVLLFLLPRGA